MSAWPGVHFLSDVPSDHDSFESHQNVAECIWQVITGSPRGGMSIAVTGPWGSGKSTVIEIVRRLLRERLSPDGAESFVYIFDAWTHQDDSPRRAFLDDFEMFLATQVVPE